MTVNSAEKFLSYDSINPAFSPPPRSVLGTPDLMTLRVWTAESGVHSTNTVWFSFCLAINMGEKPLWAVSLIFCHHLWSFCSSDMPRNRYFIALEKREEVYDNRAEPLAMRIAFLITRKDVGISNDKFSVPQGSYSAVSGRMLCIRSH